MVKYFEFECGCKWPIIKESENPELFPELDVDMEHLPDCNLAWRLIGRGDTKGVFQLESRLGQTWAKRLIPQTIEHMSALVALIRPGCLNVKDDEGISMTEHYCRRKNREELSQVIHKELDPILAATEQSILYQEQCMRLGAVIADFDLKQVDRLRKAIGKKSLKEMAEVKKEFLEGAKVKEIIPYELAETIWGWIEKSGRYLFNKCISPNSIVETKSGMKTIDELIIGEEVYTQEGFCKVLDKIESGEKDIYKITTDTGKTIECTMDHKIMCGDGKKRTLKKIIENSYSIVCLED